MSGEDTREAFRDAVEVALVRLDKEALVQDRDGEKFFDTVIARRILLSLEARVDKNEHGTRWDGGYHEMHRDTGR